MAGNLVDPNLVVAKSSAISSDDAPFPRSPTSPHLGKGAVYGAVGLVTIGEKDSVGSQYRLCRLSSSARISNLRLWSESTNTCVASLGLYNTQDAAGTAGTPVKKGEDGPGFVPRGQRGKQEAFNFKAGFHLSQDWTWRDFVPLEQVEKRLWEMLELKEDPFKHFDLTLTLTGRGEKGGKVALFLDYVI